MGYSEYNTASRTARSSRLGYHTKSLNEIFTQQKENKIHASMVPQNIDFRECRDSDKHPNTLPVILSLDVTGSMGFIPHELVKDGLPTLMGSLIQNGVEDTSLLLLAIGDHQVDEYPLQVGQFESGDEELDMWLTRTYLESGGGGNSGESYLLAWYFAAFHTVSDNFEKRKKRGFLFTCGDEPCLKTLPKNVIKEIMGEKMARGELNSDAQLLKAAQESYNVFHLHIMEGYRGPTSISYWRELLGQNCIEIKNYKDTAKIIAKTIKDNLTTSETKGSESEVIL